MAKRRRENTPDKIDRKIYEGFGQGIGKEYKPWLKIQDVPSKGKVTRLLGIKIDRMHELFSDLEKHYFYIIEFSDAVKDIREQFPLLPLEQTVAIADEMNIKHATDPKTGENIVMTTDFLITLEKNGSFVQVARTVKTLDDLENPRTIEKLEVERRYWEQKGIDWGIVTENEIHKDFSWNIGILRPFFDLVGLDGFENMSFGSISKLSGAFKQELIGSKIAIREIAEEFDERMMLKPGTSIALFKHLIITKQIKVDLFERLNIDFPITIEEIPLKMSCQEVGAQ